MGRAYTYSIRRVSTHALCCIPAIACSLLDSWLDICPAKVCMLGKSKATVAGNSSLKLALNRFRNSIELMESMPASMKSSWASTCLPKSSSTIARIWDRTSLVSGGSYSIMQLSKKHCNLLKIFGKDEAMQHIVASCDIIKQTPDLIFLHGLSDAGN